jgi:hypothetical protein
MKNLVGFILVWVCTIAHAQVDSSYIYNPATPFGALDIRIAKSATRYYYLQENRTVSFRESAPGVKTDTYNDMTSWDSSPYSQGNMREKNGNADYFIMNYRLLFPVGYDTSYNDGYPLIVMMHGAGERANCWDNTCHWADRSWKYNTNNPPAPTTVNHPLLNNDHNLLHGGKPHLDARNLAGTKLPNDPTLHSRAFPGFVLFAQNLNGWDTYAAQDAIRLIRLVIKKYNIDPNRVYVHGLSNGGSGTYEVVKRAPWLFAAALPMSAITDASIISKGMTPQVANVPIWTFQGGRDTSPLPSKTEGIVKKFREAGADVRYSLYPNLGHGTWNTAYSEPEFFSWMLAKDKSKVHVFFNNPTICGTTGAGVKMGYARGFLAYQWEKDGALIPGADSAELVVTEPGVYRARFSRLSATPTEEQWNKWSQPVNITVNNPPQATIIPLGSTHLRGPDNAAQNTVRLRSTHADAHYYWYRNGTLINIPNNNVDDTVRVLTLLSTSSTQNGAITLLTRSFDNCPSPASEPVNIYFGNSAPLLADTNIPSNFQGSATSGGTTSLSWTDNSSVEARYEVWRRKTGQSFVFAGYTGVNGTTFNDSGLEPSTTYDYKVRAVNNDGRSRYAPSDVVNTNLTITTDPDPIPPTPPQNLTVVSNTDNSVTLSWVAGTDNVGIRQYIVYYDGGSVATGSTQTTYTVTGLTLNTVYDFTVKTQDLANLLSDASNEVSGNTYVTGLVYGHSTGAWTDLDQITNWNAPEFTGTVPNFTLSPRTQEDFFNFEFKGYLYITAAGSYQFRTTSDDGSRLALNGVVLVDNDGVHGNVTVTSALVNLGSGPQTINVKFFEYTSGQNLRVEYRGPDTGNNWIIVPSSALRSGTPPATLLAAGRLAGSNEARAESEETLAQGNPLRIFIYPNPSRSDNLYVQVESEGNEPVQIRLLDMMGRQLHQDVLDHTLARQGAPVTPHQTLINGMYIMVVHQGKNQCKEKVIIRN